jgi:hypothetical protein
MGGLVRNAECNGNCGIGNSAVFGVIGELENQVTACLGDLIQERFGKETGRLAKPKLHWRPATIRHFPLELVVPGCGKALVEVLPESWNHNRSSIAPKLRLPTKTALAS